MSFPGHRARESGMPDTLMDQASVTVTRCRTFSSIPRSCGESLCSTRWCIRRTPSASKVRTTRFGEPIADFVWVTISLLAISWSVCSGFGAKIRVVYPSNTLLSEIPRRWATSIGSSICSSACMVAET